MQSLRPLVRVEGNAHPVLVKNSSKSEPLGRLAD